jgi:predicted MFS family arabinose efflux permease
MALQYAFPGALLQLYSLHLDNLGFSPAAIGLCCAGQALATVLTALLVGQAADRWFRAERCLAVCAAGAGGTLWLLAGLDGLPAVFAVTLLFWLLTTPTLLLGAAVAFVHLPQPERQYGSVRLWGTVGWAVPSWLLLPACLGGWINLETPGGCADLFRLGSLFAFALAAYALCLPPTPPRPVSGRRAAPLAALALLRGRAFAVYCLCTFGVCVTWPFATQAIPILLKRLGVARLWIAPSLTLCQLSEITGLALLPMLLLRLGSRGVMLLGLGAWTAALCILAADVPPGLAIPSIGLNGLVVSCFLVAGQVYVNGRVGDDVKASAQALLTFVNGIGQLVGHLLVGYLRRQHGGELPQVFAVGAAVMASLFVLFAVGFRDRPAAEPLPAPGPLTPSSRRLRPADATVP